jgi:parallel beta-helix repeat protein
VAEIPQATIGPGTELDGFVIDEVAGRGGMGVVYRARQRQPERIVALKVIAAGLADDPQFGARFRREATIAAQIEHPNVIPVHAVGEARGVLYIAMRFVDGNDLRTLLARQGRIEPRRAATIVDQAAQALDAAHAHGLVHRDVKPANILIATIGGRDHVYLSDFGISRHVEGSQGLTGTGAFLGTIDYVSPEQARGERVDARADVYSLGCVLFEALSGSVPFPFDSDLAKLYARDSKPPPSILDRVPELSEAFELVLSRAMAKSPDERYQSAGDLGRAAVAAALGEPLPGFERIVAVGEAAPEGPEARAAATEPFTTRATGGASQVGTRRPAAATELMESTADTDATATASAGAAVRRRRMLGGALIIAVAAAIGIALAVSRGGSRTNHAATHVVKGGGATTLKVPTQYRTVEAAIKAARPGQTIAIAGGTFREQVTIDKNLVLTGAGANSTTIRAPRSLVPGLGGLRTIVTVVGPVHVAISKLRIAGPAAGSCTSPASINTGILVGQAATLSLRSAAVTDIRDTPAECIRPEARAIAVGLAPNGGQTTPGHATITDDVISGYGDEGIDVAGAGSMATITNSRISGVGSAPGQFVAGIFVKRGASARITGNTITANHCTSPAAAAAVRGGKACGPDPLTQSHDEGIVVVKGGTSTVISGNTLSGNDVGIYLWNSSLCCTVTGNTLAKNWFFGDLIRNTNESLNGGVISGGQIGIGVVADKSNTTVYLHGVSIRQTSVAETQPYTPGAYRATVVR